MVSAGISVWQAGVERMQESWRPDVWHVCEETFAPTWR